MFNVGSGEFLVIFLIALIVLGPDKLPDAAKKVGKVMGDLRKMSSGFQHEMRQAMDVDGIKEALDVDGLKKSLSLDTQPTLPPVASSAEWSSNQDASSAPTAVTPPTEITGSVPSSPAPTTPIPGAGLTPVRDATAEPPAKGQQGAA